MIYTSQVPPSPHLPVLVLVGGLLVHVGLEEGTPHLGKEIRRNVCFPRMVSLLSMARGMSRHKRRLVANARAIKGLHAVASVTDLKPITILTTSAPYGYINAYNKYTYVLYIISIDLVCRGGFAWPADRAFRRVLAALPVPHLPPTHRGPRGSQIRKVSQRMRVPSAISSFRIKRLLGRWIAWRESSGKIAKGLV